VLTGDFALAEALELVQRSGYPEAMPEFIRTLRVLIRGESIETSNKFNYELSEAEYYDIISEKSASLFALSCKVGALSQGLEFADSLGHFGWNLGMAFQMIDDLDDIVDNPNKSYDCDLRNGYLALPMIRVLNNLQDGHRDRMIGIIEEGDFSPANERYIVSTCMDLGTIDATNVEIRKHLTRARESLVRFNDSRARALLVHVVDDLTTYADRQVDNFASYLRESTA
jgi:octaprenyl-diphosphate synthase